MDVCEARENVRHWPADLLYGDDHRRQQAVARRAETFREQLVPHLRAWARHGVHFSLSPWDSPAWIGLLYGRFYRDAADFAARALEEYAQCLGAGWLEIGPSCLPAAPGLLQHRSSMPPGFGAIAVVAHEPMMYRFPFGYPDAARRGERNPHFLDPEPVCGTIIPLLRALDPHLRMVVLRPGRVYPTEEYPFTEFRRRLEILLEALPPTYRYAVELNTPEYLRPEYFACLRSHGTTHVVSQGEDMPSLLEQIQRPDVLTADVVVVRTPQEIPGPMPRQRHTGLDAGLRLGILETVRRCIDEKRTLYVDLGDRPEGSAPLSLLGLMALLDPDLAKLSPLKKFAA